MFSCSLKNGTTIEYLTVVSVLIATESSRRGSSQEARLSAGYADRLIVYQANPQVSDTFSNALVGQYLQFLLAGLLQPRARFAQVAVPVARMAHELGGSVGQAFQQLLHAGLGEDAGLRDAAKVVCRGDPAALGHFAGAARQQFQPARLYALLEGYAARLVAVGERRTQRRSLVGDAHGFDAVALCEPHGDGEKSRQHLHVLVAIQMSRVESRGAHFSNLRVPLPFDLAQVQSFGGQSQQQAFRTPCEQVALAQQSSDLPGRSHRCPVAQVQMHSYSEARELLRGFHAVCKRAAVGQQRRAGHNSVAVGFSYAAVHTFRPAQIIRIHNQVPHPVPSLSFKNKLAQLYLACVPPVPVYSYTVAISIAFVPLTVRIPNSSMQKRGNRCTSKRLSKNEPAFAKSATATAKNAADIA